MAYPRDYDHLALGQPEPNPDAGSFWRSVGRALTHNSDQAAAALRADATMPAQDQVGRGFRTVDGNPFGAPEQPRPASAPSGIQTAARQQAVAAPTAPQQVAPSTASQVAPGIYQHGRGQYSDNPDGMSAVPRFGSSDPAAQFQPAQVRGFNPSDAPQPRVQAPDIAHSGNDWTARNELRNARVSANTLRGEWDMYRDGAIDRNGRPTGKAQTSAAQRQYAAMLEADRVARSADANARTQAMVQNANLGTANLREWGENQRAMMNNATDQARLGLDAARFRDAQRTNDVERRQKELSLDQAQRLDAIRQEMANATTPEARAEAERRWIAMAGDVSRGQNARDRYMVVGGGQEYDDRAGQAISRPQRLFDSQTGRFVDGGGQAASAQQVPNDKSQLRAGQTYQTPQGLMVYDGQNFWPAA